MFEELDLLLASDTFAKEKAKPTLKLKEGERREVCILFADVKGFTELSEKLDHEEVQNILDKLMQLFSVRIKHFGGYIDKYEGDLVMALFGAKVASERDTEAAIHAAMQMLEILEQFNELLSKKLHSDTRLEVRIGINTGWVTTGKVGEKREGDFTVYGNAVNIASRMESNAPTNRIMLPEKTMLLAKDVFKFEDHSEIKVKGISKPMSVFLVQGLKKDIQHRWQTRRSAHVGREKELTFLAEKYDLVKERMVETEFHEYKPLVIGIKGEPGIGKSRLADEFLRSKPELSFYLHGTTQRIAQHPFCMFTSLMRRYLGISQIEDRETTRQKLEAGLKELEGFLNNQEEIEQLHNMLPIIGRLLGVQYEDVRLELEPKELKPHLQTAIRHFLEAAAAKANFDNSPLILVLEDLQWMDEPSAVTLEFLMLTLNLEEKRKGEHFKHLMILLTYRPEYEPSRQTKIDADYHEIELVPISEESMEELIGSMVGDRSISQKTLRKVIKKSAGNPFYIEEWINLILELPELDLQEDLPVPNTLHALVLSRIDRLEIDVKLLLQKAAVVGREFFVNVLSEMEKRLERQEDITEHLEHLESGDFVLSSTGTKISTYLFKHIITREVAYNTLLIANRKVLHRIAGEVIEELFADRLEKHWCDLAEHYEKGEVWDKAADYLFNAAEYAKGNYDNQAALGLYDRLLRMQELRPEISSPQVAINAHFGKGAVLQLTGEWQAAAEEYQRAVDMAYEIEDRPLAVRTLNSRGNLFRMRGEHDRALDDFQKSLAIAEELGDKRGISVAVNNMGTVFSDRGDDDRALEYYEKKLSIAEELGDKKGISAAVNNMGLVFMKWSDYDRALECFQKTVSIAEELGDKQGISMAVGNMGIVFRLRGDYDYAFECYQKKLSIAEALGDKRGISYTVGNMGNVFSDRGDYDRAFECYQKMLSISEELGDKSGISIAVSNMGIVFADRGDYDRALECYQRSLSIAEAFGDKQGISIAVGNIGIVFHDRGDYDRALECYQRSLSIAEALGDKQGISVAAGNMGIVFSDRGVYDRTLECYQKQLSIAEELGDKSGISITVGNMGEVFFLRGFYSKALEYLEQALDLAIELKQKADILWFSIAKTRVLYKQTRFVEALDICQECLRLAEEIEDGENIFQSKLLLQKIHFSLAENEPDRKKAIDELKSMFPETKNDENHADLHYELWRMHKQLSNNKDSDSHRDEAVRLYKTIYTKKPKYEFKKRIEELEAEE